MNRVPGFFQCSLWLLLVLFSTAGSAVAQQGGVSPGQELAERYVPVMYIREQEQACAVPPGGGEPYLPLPVEIVLDNERVLLRDAEDNDAVVAVGPNAAELATFGANTYMDFPGDSRRPGCTYETDERARMAELGIEPSTYAHVVFDEEGQRLALQYWFYWYFNDWNNTHESDWEMIQLFWDDITGVEQALQVPPNRIGYAQHGNGELADWGDDKVRLEDETHPLVYPAAGSHATFFSDETYLAWGERNSGFGCDVSSGPSVRVPLTPILVPDEIDPEGEFAWLLYEGRWGERQPASFNGPLGAGVSTRWLDPWEASDNWRPFSIVVPSSTALGPTMTEAFCAVTEAGSQFLLQAMVHPWLTLLAAVVVVGILAYFVRISLPILKQATRMYQENWKVFVGIGLIAIPIGILFNGIQAFLVARQPLRYLIHWFDDTAGARLTAVSTVGGVQQLAMLLIIAPAIVQAVADIHRGETPAVLRSYRLAAGRVSAIAASFGIILVLGGIPLLLIIGIPLAVWLVVRWHFFVQVLVMDHTMSSRDALRRSADLVSNRWWRTLLSVFLFDLIATVPGILVGFGLLTIGHTAVGFANGISSLLYAVFIPFSVIAVTLLYLDYGRAASPVVTESPNATREYAHDRDEESDERTLGDDGERHRPAHGL